ncbi:response regulator [Alteromonas sp. C1M14]|uniref:response regulator n=1 Tax=Alteromonas sp. C1M14 TaxID=2841567 RepID=UPI001C08DA6B|nr:response regulator [Alteromonas sp. C1M14]MBU2977544.1 response regulator [Alteromonas sp. C1M14]
MPGLDNLKQKIKNTYIIAIVTMTLLLTIYYGWTQHYLNATAIQPQIINIAGYQRMLSQRIAFLENLLIAETDTSQRITLERELISLVRDFTQNNEILVGRQSLDGTFNSLTDKLEALYFKEPAALDKHVAAYTESALQLVSTQPKNYVTVKPTSLNEASAMLKQLDFAVKLFEEQLSQQIALNQRWLLAIWVLTLMFSLAIVHFLFKPLRALVLEQFNLVKDARKDAQLEREQANRLVATKEEFLASMSHEFRSPIAAIIGALELIPNMKTRQEQLIQRAELSCYRLLMLTSNLVDSMQNKQVDETLEQEDFDLVRLLDDGLSQFFFSCHQKNLNYQVVNETRLPHHVKGCPSPIIKALKNVLDNAVKFTHEGLISIHNTVSAENGKLLLTIRVVDTGIGIKPQDCEYIFERFYKAHQNPRRYSGAGVGLYAARRQLREIGGNITVSSALHSGSEFILTVPLQASELDEASKPINPALRFAVVEDQEITRIHLCYLIEHEGFHVDTYKSGAELLANQEKIKDYCGIITDYYMPGLNGAELSNYLQAMLGNRVPPIILVSAAPQISNIIASANIPAWQIFVKPLDKNRFIDAIHHLTLSKESPAPLRNNVSVLIIEDEPINAEIIQDMVENLGYDATVVPDGESALSKAGSENFDVILLDLHLPDMSGFEVATILKERGCKAHMVAVTASAYESDKKRSFEVGIRYHLVKPVAYQELKNTLKLLLALPD